MLTYQTRSERVHIRSAPGFASVLLVLSSGLALMIMLMIMYEDTAQSQNEQKNNLLANDYQQREDAVLRALTNVVPNKAILCMKDNSRKAGSSKLKWQRVFEDSFEQANATQSVTSATLEELGVTSSPSSANTADMSNIYDGSVNRDYNTRAVASSIFEPANTRYYVSEGTDRHIKSTTSQYPPPLKFKPYKNNRSNTNWPVISMVKVYDEAKVTGWIDKLSDDQQFGVMPSPSPNFNYGNNGQIIAKHNWWTFKLNFSKTSSNDTTNDAYLTSHQLRQSASKQFIIAIYEIPSQLAIHAASYADFGTFQDGTEWNSSNVTVEGGVFAGQVKSTGSFTADAIASRKGVELKDGTSAMSSTARDDALALGKAYNISSASDAGKIAFIPINRGLDFYDRFSVNDGQTVNFGYNSSGTAQKQYYSGDGLTSNSTVSPTNWDYYSIGANQCVMNLVVSNIVNSADQTPTEIVFTYLKTTGDPTSITYTKDPAQVDGSTSLLWDESDIDFPFTTGITFEGRPCLNVSMEKLQTHLVVKLGTTTAINRSISINPDYINGVDIPKPYRDGIVDNTTNDIYKDDLCLRIEETEDLHNFTTGFSLVTNLRLIIADNVNLKKITTGDLSGEYPPLSLFSPEKVFGDSAYSAKVEIEGQITSLAKAKKNASGNLEAIPAISIPSGIDGNTNNQTTIDLKGITDPKKLPPINIMNWMVIVREKHN